MARPDAAAPALVLKGLCQRFGATEVLRGLNLSVHSGECLAVIGPNGAGKSTLFNAISGRYPPSAGEVWLRGRRVDGWAPHRIRRQGLARSFQVAQLFKRLTVRDHLRCALLWRLGHRYTFWRLLNGLRDVGQGAEQWLQRLGLSDKADALATELTYAEQRALELGVTLAGGAEVVLLDEPTAGMSQSETRRFVALMREVTQGRTLVVVEHDMGVVFELADRIAVLVQGELIACDTPAAVRANARVRAAYLGSLADA